MNIRFISTITLITILFSCQTDSSKNDLIVQKNVMIQMSDGVKLATNISKPSAEGKYPVILVRTPYGKDHEDDFGFYWVEKGYVYIVQDCRGTNKSGGEWNPGVHEYQDGIDTRDWIIKQEWSNGKIGTSGGSYLGYTQFTGATEVKNPPLALFAFIPLFDWYDFVYYGGAFSLGDVFSWSAEMATPQQGEGALYDEVDLDLARAFRMLPLIDLDQPLGVELTWVREWIKHPHPDPIWPKFYMNEYYAKMQVPVITVSGWYDIFVNQALRYHSDAKRKNKKNHYLIVGPWGHAPNYVTGEREFGDTHILPLEQLEASWFDHWLKDKPMVLDSLASLKLFIMGKNEWRDEDSWPLDRTKYVNYYFTSTKGANSLSGDGELTTEMTVNAQSDSYVYDPKNPVPTIGGQILFGEFGAFDQREVEERKDVLVYTSDIIENEIEVTGPVKVVLYAATDGKDTDWTAKLIDVYPDGRAFNLCEGIIRARYNENPLKPVLIKPNKIYKYDIDLWATSNVFLPGHKIRVEISSSNFPRFDRNPNTGNTFGMDSELRIAHQKVYHSKEYPSHIVLPVIPSD